MSAAINQRRVPGLSRLYGDYLYDFDKVRRFYPGGPAFDLDGLARAAAQVKYPDASRRAMAAVLERQQAGWGAEAAARAHVAEFAAPGTVAIVTGQQVGLFGGPLLGAIKAMTAVLLAAKLRERGVAAVPVFWLATQDHDLDEVNQAWGLDAESQPQRFALGFSGAAGAPVGGLPLPVGVEAELDRWEKTTGGAAAGLRASYAAGTTLGDAFARWLHGWFAPWGLVVFDPMQAPEAAALWQPHYLAAMDRQEELAAALGARARELEAGGYHAQVEQTAAASMLYLHRDGVRQGLRRQRGRWLLGEEEIAAAGARAWIAERPQEVSAAVLLRPLLQDVALPTLAQVTGPAETAYLAQSAVLFGALGVRMPVAYPRVSATVVDAKSRRLLDKYGLELEQVWSGPAAELLARQALPAAAEQRAARMRAQFDAEFGALAQELEALDPTLVDAAQGAVQKIRHQLEQLEARVARSFARRSGEISAQAQFLEGHLYPQRHLQERVLAAASFASAAPDLAERLHAGLDVTLPGHQIIAV